MEVGPSLHELDTIPQPDLLTAYADREITIFGIPGKLGNLADMCPVDLSQATLEAKNEFVIKAANEAGLDIQPEHEGLFSETLAQRGLERKFTVAEKEPEPEVREDPARTPSHVNRPTVETKRTRDIPTVVLSEQAVRTAAERAGERQPHQAGKVALSELVELDTVSLPAQPPDRLAHRVARIVEEPSIEIAHQAIVHMIPEHREVPESPHVINDGIVRPPTEAIQTVDIIAEPAQIGRTRRDVAIAATELELEPIETNEAIRPLLTDELVMPAPADTEELPFTSSVEELAESDPDLQLVEEDEGETPVTFADWQELPPALEPVAGVESETREAAEILWRVELAKPPGEVYDDFVTALDDFVEQHSTETAILEPRPEAFEPPIAAIEENVEQAEPVPLHPVVAVVAKRLAEAEPEIKEQAAPVIKNIVGVIHGIRTLEAQAADPEVVAEIKTQLEDLCITLFETVGIEYDEETLKQFVQILLYPDFQPHAAPLPQEAQVEDLAYAGTHEAKYADRQLSRNPTDMMSHLKLALGVFALFCISTANQNRLRAAASA